MSRKTFHSLLQRYLNGNCTEEEKLIVEQWYQMHDDEELPEIKKTELNIIEERIWSKVNGKIQKQKSPSEKTPVRPLWLKLSVAATLTGLLMVSIFLFKNNRVVYSEQKQALASNNIKKQNHTENPLVISLADGSRVTLQPNSSLSYSTEFGKGKREVFMEGEAFFEVAKDKHRPFFVISKNLITRVVGTSFIVRNGKGNESSEVVVLTGKVEVTENAKSKDLYERIFDDEQNVVLTPNQRVVYESKTKELIKTLVNKPLPIASDGEAIKPKVSFVFNDIKLNSVFDQLEESYGINITPEESKIYECTFTGDLNDQNLYTNLDFICQSIGATYEIEGTGIIIKGGNCN
jgi:transmembrane sensor